MDIKLIDEFRRRTNASYDEARYYLDRHNGDLLEAIIDFEKERTGSPRQDTTRPKSGNFLNGLIRVVQSLFDIKLVVTDKEMKTYNIPIIALLILFSVWQIILLVTIVLLIMGFKFNFIREPDQNVNIESIVNKMKDKVHESRKNG